MRRSPLCLSACLLFLAMALLSARADIMSREQIIAEGEKVANAQLAQLDGAPTDLKWVSAVMWAGFSDFSHVSSNPAYTLAIRRMGQLYDWTPVFRPKYPYDADDLCIGQTFLDAFETDNDPARLVPIQQRVDAASDYFQTEKELTWWWCDALFMAPAVDARLSAITQNPKYLEAMSREWWKTAGLLYDKKEHLFYRDKTFLRKRAPNGKKIFWNRGNGWVFAGLARTLTYMSQDFADRGRFIAVFKDMAAKLASLQQADGTWRPSLLDPGEYPYSEMSGTALDCFAFAWGVENGLLDRATYLPVIAKAWAAMLASRRPDGLIGYVQGVGLAPGAVSSAGTQLYATGAFLMAASQLSRLAPIALPPAPKPTALVSIPSLAKSGRFSKIADTIVDAGALTLAPNATYGSAINGEAFQQDIIHTSAGWQYVAYYDGARNVCVGRRKLPDGHWQVLRLTDYKFTGNDAHNTISLGICERDGTIHLAFDHHVSPLHYRVSKPGVGTHPESLPWDASLFGPVHSDLEPGKPITVTYPRFWNTPNGGLQMHYRDGTSGNGNNMLVDYNPATGTWSGTRQIDSSQGTYQDELGLSTSRNAYPNGYDYDTAGRLQATWVWRESPIGANHDLLYAYSNDLGKTWFTNSGQPISGPASIDTPGLAVEKISGRYGLMNNQAQAIDSANCIHVIMWSCTVQTPINAVPDDVWGVPADRRYVHYWRDATGQWHENVLPWVAGSRPRLFVDGNDNLFLIYNRPEPGEPMEHGIYFTRGALVIASASAATHWHDWHIVATLHGPFINEMIADTSHWQTEKILSIVAQETPKVIGDPSPLHVIDYKQSK